MLTLIKREIEDNIVHFIVAVILAAIIIAIGISMAYRSESGGMDAIDRFLQDVLLLLAISLLAIWCTLLCGMGVGQMYTDRTKKISSFLLTLPVTRRRILIARVIAGILAILLVLVPVTVTVLVLLQRFGPPIPFYNNLVFRIFIAAFLVSFACYCIGLHGGWNSGKVAPTLGSLFLALIFIPLVIIKGISPQVFVILLLFIAALLIRTWQKFMTTSL
jgi:ABC-type transport system involved in multi-copper enzyme maturation permease subunit